MTSNDRITTDVIHDIPHAAADQEAGQRPGTGQTMPRAAPASHGR